MLDLKRLQKIELSERPLGQILLAETFMRLDFTLPRKTEIILEGVENLPRDRGVFLAMNHTDRYNYWPFQYQMYRHGGLRFTATWVKGKYYENGMMAAFFDSMNNIPLPSRGYVISTEFRRHMRRPPTGDEYRLLRDTVDAKTDAIEAASGDARLFAQRFLGLADGAPVSASAFRARFDDVFDPMMREVTRLNRAALVEKQLNVLVFPEGTRSLKLARGLTGLMQMAQHLGATIVPVGCNGSDKVYPTNSPFARGGRIVYRVGAPLELDGPELAPYRVLEEFTPFSRDATARFGERFEAGTRVLMRHINALLDPEYQAVDGNSTGVQGMDRFL